jgi:Tol biopolymer transport system component
VTVTFQTGGAMNRRRLQYTIVAATVVAASTACRDSSLPLPPVHPMATLTPPPGLGATLVFTKLSESQDEDEAVVAEIYIMNADGSDQRRITNNTHADLGANLSPDGKTVAFHQTVAGLDCPCTIQLVDVDDAGTERTLTVGMWPSWSPNGKKIAFNAPGAGGVGDIWVINVDGTGLTNLTQTPSGEARPAWSSSGQQIVFQSNRSGNADIWVMDADGSNAVQLTSHSARDEAPDWSPDGRKIVFQSFRDDPRGDIYVMNADGTELTRLTFSDGRDVDPAWSPNGRQIVFDSDRDFVVQQIRQVFVMNADGTDQRALTALPSENGHAGWGRGRAVLP